MEEEEGATEDSFEMRAERRVGTESCLRVSGTPRTTRRLGLKSSSCGVERGGGWPRARLTPGAGATERAGGVKRELEPEACALVGRWEAGPNERIG